MTEFSFFDDGLVTVIFPAAVVAIFAIVLNVIDNFTTASHLRIPDKQHSWRALIDSGHFICNQCDQLMVKKKGSVYCDSCGVCAHSHCYKKVSRRFRCKDISIETEGSLKHKWLKGNLPENSTCEVCQGDCYIEDVRCIWCHRAVHQKCHQNLGDVCDFGALRPVVIPPTHVHLGKKKRIVRGPPPLRAISKPNIPNWTPLFVIGNPSSGSRVGEDILSGFRSLLNPLQVSEIGPSMLDRLAFILSLLPEETSPIVLVAGGDGSVASVLTSLYSHHEEIKCQFKVGIVPLGTGNDLSRVFGWGKEEPSPFSAFDLLNQLIKAKPVLLDRWEVRLSKGRQFGIRRGPQMNYMYNYMSVGVDARVTLDFHKARNSSLYFGGRLINKALYLAFGTQQVVERKCTGLEKDIVVELDGLRVCLPELEAVVVLNIPSWGAGCLLWQLKDSDEEIAEQSVSDGKLEVVGIYSSFHMAQLQVGLSTPYRIGQASTVRIFLKKKLPMQIDGEPWLQPGGMVEVTFGGQVNLLQAEPSECPESD